MKKLKKYSGWNDIEYVFFLCNSLEIGSSAPQGHPSPWGSSIFAFLVHMINTHSSLMRKGTRMWRASSFLLRMWPGGCTCHTHVIGQVVLWPNLAAKQIGICSLWVKTQLVLLLRERREGWIVSTLAKQSGKLPNSQASGRYSRSGNNYFQTKGCSGLTRQSQPCKNPTPSLMPEPVLWPHPIPLEQETIPGTSPLV